MLRASTEIDSNGADNDNVASANPGMIPSDAVDSDSVGFLTASVSLPGSDNVIAALALPRRKGSLVSVIDDPTDTSASDAAAVADLSAATAVTFDGPTDNTASVGASSSAAVIVEDLSDNTASVATTVIIDDPTDNTASAVASSATVVNNPTDNTASAGTGDAAREETTTTAHVSLPGSDNKIYAYHVPARREGMLVFVNGEGSN
ncbi:unnamed protein product [Closterium sp. Naga37s-1]|nr:unnamed protein product [Closterium sp. Naga37s-1]